MQRVKLHVTPHPEGWRVLAHDGTRVSGLFLERDEAIRRGEGLAKSFGDATLYVHARGTDDAYRMDFGSVRPSGSSFWPPR